MRKIRQVARSITVMLLCVVLGQAVASAQSKPAAGAGTIKVSGVVCDEQKDPVPGAYVFVDELRNGSVTAIDGSFTVDVPANGHITISFIGMETERIPVDGRTSFDVTLREKSQRLNDVVVTGYQTLSKERSAGSYSTIRGGAIADKANARGSVLESLEGATTGMLVNMSSTAGEDEKFIVRGVNTINSNKAPLFVVDGVAVAGESIESLLSGDDIASVTVLKDATAASIWGSQAANGVIVIETKSGHNTNGKFNVTYSGTYTYKGKMDYGYQDLMDSPTFIKNALEVFDPSGYKYASAQTGTGATNFIKNGVLFPHEVPMYAFANGEISEAERDAQLAVLAKRDWYSDYAKYMMSNAWLTRHQVSIEGGTAKSKLFSSIGYEGNQGTAKDFTGTVKMNVRGVVDVNKWLRVDMGLNASLAKNNGHSRMGYGSGRAVTNRTNPSMSSLPYAALYDENGVALDHSVFDMMPALKAQAEAALGKSLDYHPADDFEASMVKSTSTNIRANAGITVKFFEGFRYEGRFAYSRSSMQKEEYLPDYTYFVLYERGTTYDKTGKVQYGPANGGDFTSVDSYGSDWTVRNQLNLDRTFSERHHVAAVAGTEIRENHAESNQNLQLGYDYQSMTSANYDITRLQKTVTTALLSPCMGSTGSMIYAPRINKFETADAIFRYFSMYANAAYTFDSKYSVNASIRVDQSNLFGTDPGVQFKPVWSVGGIWHAKKEDFLKDADWLNTLSVRASYGLGGNSPTSTMGGPYNILTPGTPYQNMATGVTYYINSPANDKIHWEKTSTANVGLDFAMFRHRLYGSVDIYKKHTTDLLDKKDLDSTTGFTSVTSNVGAISNNGVELTLGGTIIRKGFFMWDASMNFTYNNNKVESIWHTPYSKASEVLNQQYVEGYPMRPVFAYTWGGLDPEKGTPRIINKDGDIYAGSNSTLTNEDVKYLGTTIPPYFGSANTSFRYKGLSLSMMFVYNFGHKIYNDQLTYWYDRLGENVHNDFDKRWREPGDELKTDIPSYLYTGKGRTYSYEKNLYMYSDIHVLNGAFLKLREIKLSYAVPSSFANTLRLSGMSVYGQINNLCYIAANKEGIDPEYSASVGQYRPMRMGPAYTFGLKINF